MAYPAPAFAHASRYDVKQEHEAGLGRNGSRAKQILRVIPRHLTISLPQIARQSLTIMPTRLLANSYVS